MKFISGLIAGLVFGALITYSIILYIETSKWDKEITGFQYEEIAEWVLDKDLREYIDYDCLNDDKITNFEYRFIQAYVNGCKQARYKNRIKEFLEGKK